VTPLAETRSALLLNGERPANPLQAAQSPLCPENAAPQASASSVEALATLANGPVDSLKVTTQLELAQAQQHALESADAPIQPTAAAPGHAASLAATSQATETAKQPAKASRKTSRLSSAQSTLGAADQAAQPPRELASTLASCGAALASTLATQTAQRATNEAL